jgi:hypothetical protein
MGKALLDLVFAVAGCEKPYDKGHFAVPLHLSFSSLAEQLVHVGQAQQPGSSSHVLGIVNLPFFTIP